jgi:hypothetical protein
MFESIVDGEIAEPVQPLHITEDEALRAAR